MTRTSQRITHALTMNGRVHGEVKDPVVSPPEVIEHRLGLLDGVVRYSLSLWRLPDGVPFDRVDLATWPQEYVQTAGSADGMTVEVRRAEQSGWGRYVIGRPSRDTAGPPVEVVIPWNGYEAHVSSDEAFSAPEAAEVFTQYYATGQIPGTFHFRPLRSNS